MREAPALRTGPPAEAAASELEQLRVRAAALLEELASSHLKADPRSWWCRRDLSLAQMHLLMVLRDTGPTTVGRLAEVLGVSLPSTSATVDRLEEHGLALRQRDDVDRRLVRVALSPEGAALAEEASGYRGQRVRSILLSFDAGELRALIKVLRAVQRCSAAPPDAGPA